MPMRLRIRLTAALAVALLGACGPRPEPSEPAHIRVLATHDFHGALLPRVYPWSEQRQVGGAAALKAYMDRAAAACGCTTLRLDGGDLMQGTLASNLVLGASTVAAFNMLTLDAAAVGNHELDWEEDVLRARQQEAQFAWLAANVYRRDTGARPDWAQPTALIERDGLTIGVVGYLTADTPQTVRAATAAPYEFRRGYAGIRDALEDVRRAGADFVAIVAHAGGDCEAGACAGEMVGLARELPAGAVHLIVGGHTHRPGQGVVNGVPIVRAGANATAFAVVDLVRQADGTRSFDIDVETVYVDAVPIDAEMTTMLAPWLTEAATIGAEPVAALAEPLENSARGDRKLGNLIADAARAAADADIGLHNPGGVRANLPAGPISYSELFDVLPFGNQVVKLGLSGAALRELIEHTGALAYYSNLAIVWDADAGDGRRLVDVRFADGREVRDDAGYTLALSDYLADGGDGLAMLIPLPRESTGPTVLDATVGYLRALPQPVRLPNERRARTADPGGGVQGQR